jgi:hypothetical protein
MTISSSQIQPGKAWGFVNLTTSFAAVTVVLLLSKWSWFLANKLLTLVNNLLSESRILRGELALLFCWRYFIKLLGIVKGITF